MKALIAAALLVATLSACWTDETVRAYGGADRIWTLKLFNGTPFPAHATLTFPKAGEIVGQGPCNRYFAAMEAPYPWFKTGPLGSTRIACPDVDAETTYFSALEAATLSEVAGDTLILSDVNGLEMVFKATD